MVGRSLILRIYLFAVVSLLVTFALVFGGSRLLLERHLSELFGGQVRALAGLLADQVEHELPTVPSPARLEALGRPLHARLDYVPWATAVERTPMLASDRVFLRPRQEAWVRLDHGGRPAGALVVHLRPPHPAPGPGMLVALAVIGVVGLLLLPPLYLWVVRPLKNMAAIARRLGEGDLETPVPVTHHDEFGELEHAFEELRERIQRMLRQKEQLLGDLSHELRGPLSRLAIAVPMLQADHPESPYPAHVAREVAAMEALVAEILALARARYVGSGEAVPLDLSELAQELVAERELAARRRGLTLTLELEPAPTTGDRSLVRRALGNLLDNALKYAAEGGRITVGTGRTGGRAIARVGNDGPGIQPGDLPEIMEPFYRPDASRARDTGGVGLGLAIARTIAGTHGGHLELRSEPGVWTEAELGLPGAS